ncbi:hypothetical protein MA16_Dca021718 [Dendrobium catenatum]|uniref:Uncharacterized protein n=1 Tax=Dendrobium catenatum TaxID=906689 RepID=A0A2I0WWR9_9ASPA|nr:hypothetical protein MA16_Dca021718 [Dendrobium catenatum]
MAELFVHKPTKRHYQHHLLFPVLEFLEPPALFHPPFPNALRPFRRGPMYSTYAELRDRMRRVKKARLGPLTPIPSPLKRSEVLCSVDRSLALGRENRKPPLSFNKFRTPSQSMATKPELRKSVSASGGRTEENKSRPGGLFSVRRSFSGLNEFKEISMVSVSGNKEKGRGDRGESKGSLRKSATGFERWKLMKATG